MRPVARVHVADLFRPLHAELMSVLRALAPDDWARPTSARLWSVRDVAAHLLDGDLRKLSFHRDGLPVPPPDRPIASDADLVAFLNALNAEWVRAARRLSPRLIVELLDLTGRQVADFVESLDPDGQAIFAVAWAGERASSNWLDTGREYTERWHHQQQIREATRRPGLTGRGWLRPVFDISVRALPVSYRGLEAPDGTAVGFDVEGDAGGRWTVIRAADAWQVFEGTAATLAARVVMGEDSAWRLFFKALDPDAVAARVRVEGDPALAGPALAALAVMA